MPWVWGAVVLVLVGLGVWLLSQSSVDVPLEKSESGTGTTTVFAPSRVGITKRPSSDVASIVASLGGTSQFQALLQSTGVNATLRGTGPYTVFVPTDGAFSLLAQGTISNMSAAEKRRLAQYHVVSGRAIDVEALETGTIAALSKDMLNFDISDTDEIVRVNSAFIIKAYQGKNGVVYLISGVLLPPQKATP
jgi:uncharacterized surface protein with fasciclin (FAS1) repeats